MEISQVQYGFMPDRGTRNAMFVLRRLVERSIQKQKDVFIDYSKAFDTVKHASLFDLLSSLDIDSHDIQLLANLYWNQQAAVIVMAPQPPTEWIRSSSESSGKRFRSPAEGTARGQLRAGNQQEFSLARSASWEAADSSE